MFRKMLPILALFQACTPHVLKNHDDYYLKTPKVLSLRYEFRAPDGSQTDGRIVLKVTRIDWPPTDAGEYTLELKKSCSFRGHFVSRKIAARYAPEEALLAAMDPENRKEVQSPATKEELAEVGIEARDGVTATMFRRSRIKNLRLPIDHTWSVEGENSSSLYNSKQYTYEIAAVWMKVLMNELEIHVPCKLRLGKILENTPETLVFELNADQEVHVFHFRKDAGLTEVTCRRTDGATIRIVEEK